MSSTTTAYRITVQERRSSALTGLEACRYCSPPHTLEEAVELLRVLLGREVSPQERHWVRPVAGGGQAIDLILQEDVHV